MNFVILGEGPEERSWAAALAAHPDHRVVALHPGFTPPLESVDLPAPAADFDEALATAGLDAALVGGPAVGRAEWLRRVAAEGFAVICLHPPGEDSEAYYQVSLSREETGAVIVPDLPARLHPGIEALRQALIASDGERLKTLRYDAPAKLPSGDLAREAFARAIDVVRSLFGEITAVNASGDPTGDRPTESLVVQVQTAGSRRAELRWGTSNSPSARWTLAGGGTALILELPDDLTAPALLTRIEPGGHETVSEFALWDPHKLILDALARGRTGQSAHPSLADGTRATEVAEGVVRSLRRGRTVELHYEDISEAGTFKSHMTSLGCLVLIGSLFTIPLALAGPPLGLPWTIYIAYAIPPVLVLFFLFQLFRFAIREPERKDDRVESSRSPG